MANCHSDFQNYNKAVKLSDDKREMLKMFRDSLRLRMLRNFQAIPVDQRPDLRMEFQTQGSFIMDTLITPENEDYDLDDGVYFVNGHSKGSRPEPKAFHQWVMQAVDTDNDYEEITDKPTCVRVSYKRGFHIDLPIYYADNYTHPDLADTKRGWILSNPVEFIGWFEEKAESGFQKAFIYESLKYAEDYQKWLTDIRKQDCQIRRIVRYMKAWGDLKRNEMPCGIIMTILIGENYIANERDDIAFRDTLLNIQRFLNKNGFKCPRPTSPVGEDLFASTSQADKDYFLNALNRLIASANMAITSTDQINACAEWNKHLGKRFICPPARVSTQNRPGNIETLKRTAEVSHPWSMM